MSERRISREMVQEGLEKARDELDTAVEGDRHGQAKYWLGRKDAYKELLEVIHDD